MNLEEKSESILIPGMVNNIEIKGAFISGYRECISDIKDLIKANPKITADKITEYLNSL